MSRTVLLLSGGMDSTALAYYLKDGGNEIHGLSVDYGQRHIRELQSAAWVADQTCLTYERITLPDIFAPSALTGGGGDVVVPIRNLVFLSLAYAYASSIGADDVAIAVIKDDALRFPDCRPAFVESTYDTMSEALGHKNVPLLRTPFLWNTKREVVEIGNALGVPWEKTWSCYGGEPEPCGSCLACKERERALGGCSRR